MCRGKSMRVPADEQWLLKKTSNHFRLILHSFVILRLRDTQSQRGIVAELIRFGTLFCRMFHVKH